MRRIVVPRNIYLGNCLPHTAEAEKYSHSTLRVSMRPSPDALPATRRRNCRAQRRYRPRLVIEIDKSNGPGRLYFARIIVSPKCFQKSPTRSIGCQ